MLEERLLNRIKELEDLGEEKLKKMLQNKLKQFYKEQKYILTAVFDQARQSVFWEFRRTKDEKDPIHVEESAVALLLPEGVVLTEKQLIAFAIALLEEGVVLPPP